MTTPRYPVSDKDMLELLNKYPFLRYHDAATDKPIYYGKSKDLEYNYYKYWDGWLEIDTEKEFDPEEKTN